MRPLVPGLVLSCLLGCSAPGPGTPPDDVTVKLDAYSGLPNPRWTLSTAEAQQLANLLRDLPSAGADPAAREGLGYRGFRIHNPGGDGGIPEELYVAAGGAAEPTGPSEQQAERQHASEVEVWLLDLAAARGYPIR